MADLMFSFLLRAMPENSAEENVFYGQKIGIKDAPFFAFLPACGAAILSPMWIVTSARCIRNRTIHPDNTIWVGGYSIPTSLPIGISETFVHPDFLTFGEYEATINDIALIKLKDALNFTEKIKAIDLPVHDNSTDGVHELVGRVIDEGSNIYSIRKLNLYRMSKKVCLSSLAEKHKQYIVPFGRLLEGMCFCAERADIFNMICVGQPGSPVVQNNTLRGIASFLLDRNCRDSSLNFYTNILHYVKWIKSITRL